MYNAKTYNSSPYATSALRGGSGGFAIIAITPIGEAKKYVLCGVKATVNIIAKSHGGRFATGYSKTGITVITGDAGYAIFVGGNKAKIKISAVGSGTKTVLGMSQAVVSIIPFGQHAIPIIEFVPLGTFWSLDWDSPDDTLTATVTARDRMELLRKNTYETSRVWENISLHDLAVYVLQDAGLYASEYHIDPALQDIIIPYGYFNAMSHRDALRQIAEAGLSVVYADRDGVIRIESFALEAGATDLTITEDEYFLPLSAPSRQEGVANEIIVTAQPLVPASTAEEVYSSSEPVTIPANTTETVTVYYRSSPVIDAVASLTGAPSGVSITETEYYAWGADITIRNTNSTSKDVSIKVMGKPLSVENRERVTARDQTSILENGVLQYSFPENPLVQRLSQARAIANTLLASFKDPRRDIEMTWRGNPALLLGDRVQVKGKTYHVIRQELEWTGALSSRITARRAGD